MQFLCHPMPQQTVRAVQQYLAEATIIRGLLL